VTYSPTSDEGAALKRFRNGELDVNPGFPPSQYPWMKTNMAGQYFLHPASTLTYILLNQTKPPFNDARVRRALSLALDRETITDRVLAVGQTPAYDFVPKIAANWSAPAEADFSARPLAERLEEARALLAEAGYGPANPLTFRFDYVGSDTSKRIVVAIQSMWAVIGIKAELQANELKSQIATVRAGGSDTAMLGWAGNPEPEFFKNLLRTGSETNFGHYSNAEFDRLTDEAVREMDLEKRKSLFQQADIIAMKEAGLLPLFFGAYRDLVQPWVKGFEPNNTRTNLTRFLRVEK
jgi:oligopeptide transport system substrate-binding protein